MLLNKSHFQTPSGVLENLPNLKMVIFFQKARHKFTSNSNELFENVLQVKTVEWDRVLSLMMGNQCLSFLH